MSVYVYEFGLYVVQLTLARSVMPDTIRFQHTLGA